MKDRSGKRVVYPIDPYRDRDVDRQVRVYRNLNRGGYSILQDGLGVGHAEALNLVDVKGELEYANR